VTTHRETILDQFTRQAVPFATAPGIVDEEARALAVLREMVRVCAPGGRVAGLPGPRVARYRLEGLLQRSFPEPGDVDEIRRLFAASLDDDGLDLATWGEGDRLRFGYPVAILVAGRP
jgi:hypothetical protein